jgi:hypothetical protein
VCVCRGLSDQIPTELSSILINLYSGHFILNVKFFNTPLNYWG